MIDLLPDIGIRTEAAAGEQMIALDCVVLLSNRNLGADQPDIADVMLRAGMMAAGEMDVERRVDVDARLAPVADRGGVALGVGGRELAAGIARAGDQAGADLAMRWSKGRVASMAATASPTSSSRTPDIRRFCQTVSRISPSPRSCAIFASPRICSQVTLPSGSATPIQFGLPASAVRADMRHAVEGRRGAKRFARHPGQGMAESFLRPKRGIFPCPCRR